MVNEDERLAEYQALEEKLIHEDAAWVPMYSRLHLFAVSKRVQNFKPVSYTHLGSVLTGDSQTIDGSAFPNMQGVGFYIDSSFGNSMEELDAAVLGNVHLL